jgi:hypothetical protein
MGLPVVLPMPQLSVSRALKVKLHVLLDETYVAATGITIVVINLLHSEE